MFFSPVRSFQSDIERFFAPFVSEEGEGQKFRRPAVNLREDGDGLHLQVQVPGHQREDIEIDLKNDVLNIRSKKERVASKWSYQEFSFGPFARVIQLPFEVEAKDVKAKLEHGVLTLNLKKREHQGQTIEIA